MLRHHFRLGNVITTVDAVNGRAHLGRRPESAKQIAVADRLILTKTDLADGETVDALVSEIRRFNQSAPLWRSAEDVVDTEALLVHDLLAFAGKGDIAARWFAEEMAVHPDHQHAFMLDVDRHDDRIRSFALTVDGS